MSIRLKQRRSLHKQSSTKFVEESGEDIDICDPMINMYDTKDNRATLYSTADHVKVFRSVSFVVGTLARLRWLLASPRNPN